MRLAPGATALTIVLNLSLLPSWTRAEEIRCPHLISEAPSVQTAEPGWTIVATEGKRPLERAGVYLGPPPEYGALVPDATHRSSRKETVTWHLVRTPEDVFSIGCAYTGTTAMVFKKLDSSVTTCTVTYDLLPSGSRQRLRLLECR